MMAGGPAVSAAARAGMPLIDGFFENEAALAVDEGVEGLAIGAGDERMFERIETGGNL